MQPRTVTIFVGLPGSGKSTYLNHLVHQVHQKGFRPEEGFRAFSPDYVMWRRGKYAWSPKHAAEAWASTYRFFGKWLRYGQANCVWDATNTKAILRSPLINIAKGYGCQVKAIYFKTPLRTCLARNAARPPERRVPESTIREMYRQLVPPSRDEGFDSVKVIRPKHGVAR